MTIEIYDLSHTLDSNMSVYPGDPVYTCASLATVKKDGYNMSSCSMGSHSGTHIDAPYHFFEDGKRIHELDLSSLIGPAYVVHILGKGPRERIAWEDIAPSSAYIQQYRIVLIHTGWSKYWGTPAYIDHPFLDKRVGEELLALGVRVLGVDTLNPDQTPAAHGDEGDFGVHQVMLGAGCVIAENLTGLDRLPDGEITVSLLPLRMGGSDGSPVRAVAWRP